MSEITLTNENFDEEVLNSDIPVLVDFWATWCGPCQMVAPIIKEIADENIGKIKVGKVNVDEQERLCMRFGISSIPTLIVFNEGKQVNKHIGAAPKQAILDLIH